MVSWSWEKNCTKYTGRQSTCSLSAFGSLLGKSGNQNARSRYSREVRTKLRAAFAFSVGCSRKPDKYITWKRRSEQSRMKAKPGFRKPVNQRDISTCTKGLDELEEHLKEMNQKAKRPDAYAPKLWEELNKHQPKLLLKQTYATA